MPTQQERIPVRLGTLRTEMLHAARPPIAPLSGIFREESATAMEAAAKSLGLSFEKAVAGTQLYIGGNPERPGRTVPDEKTWVKVKAREPKDYTALWAKVKEMAGQVELSVG